MDYSYFPRSFEEILVKNIEQFFEGRYPKRTLFQRLFPLATSVYFSLIVIAYYLYPTSYSPFTNTISDLGNPILNPDGFGFFSAAFLYLAVIMVPFYQFIYQHLRVLSSRIAKLALVTNFIASCGFIALALFPNTAATLVVHVPAALASFGGMILGGLFYYIVIIKDAFRKKGTNRVIIVFGTIANVIIGIAVTQLIDLPTFTIKNTPALPAWEWTLFAAITASAILFFNAMPEIHKKVAIYQVLADSRPVNRMPEDNPYSFQGLKG